MWCRHPHDATGAFLFFLGLSLMRMGGLLRITRCTFGHIMPANGTFGHNMVAKSTIFRKCMNHAEAKSGQNMLAKADKI
jgi:hypothetical protein